MYVVSCGFFPSVFLLIFVLEVQISLVCSAPLELESMSTNKSKAEVWLTFHGLNMKGFLTTSCLCGTR